MMPKRFILEIKKNNKAKLEFDQISLLFDGIKKNYDSVRKTYENKVVMTLLKFIHGVLSTLLCKFKVFPSDLFLKSSL